MVVDDPVTRKLRIHHFAVMALALVHRKEEQRQHQHHERGGNPHADEQDKPDGPTGEHDDPVDKTAHGPRERRHIIPVGTWKSTGRRLDESGRRAAETAPVG